MQKGLKLFVFIVAGVLVFVAAALLLGEIRWRYISHRNLARLRNSDRQLESKRYTAADIKALPAPVQRCFRKVLKEGQALITDVSLKQSGEINMSPDGEDWKPFSAAQAVITGRPGFYWDVKSPIVPGFSMRGYDAYISGSGMFRISLQGIFSPVHLKESRELSEGELYRYLAESVWYPTVLLPGNGISWEAVGDNSAIATLKDGEISVSLLFRFGSGDLIESCYAESRGRMSGKETIPTPWLGRFSNYKEHEGMLVPGEGQVAWMISGREHVYFRCRVEEIRFGFAE